MLTSAAETTAVIDGRYVWLPLRLEGESFRIDWQANRSLGRQQAHIRRR
ncbi:hypothetical protein [Pseudoxanthomonas winnipegensis]|nr:hypothetical protein [Pseudoxanthomonas winnipegensis]